MKKIALVLVLLMSAAVFISIFLNLAAAKEKSLQLSLVNFVPDIPPGSNWARLFINNIEEMSNGTIKVRLMGPEAIPSADAPAAVKRGTVDIASALSPFCDALVPGSSSIGRAEYSPMELRNGPAFKYYRDQFAKKGIYYLGASLSSLAQVQTVFYLRKEIESLKDLEGLKIASMGGSNRMFIEKLGAVCVPIDFPDYFTSMERGTIDGYNIGIPGIQDFSLTPVTKAMLNEPFSSCGGMMIMNMATYKGLTPEQQAILNRAMIQAEIDGARMFTEVVEKVKKDISTSGVKIIHLSPADSKKFYLDYRNAMWEEDMNRWPHITLKLKTWLVDPDFPRAN
ncbi:MAG: TRAP transporter substrate-binding protein DctP [Deltaproteobacteria bacterium]|nr:TRAP transporter substrate-binding protein DctP [Deltaproteobacteria bacterium]